ncbi:Uncharacterized conserved protein, DUF1015 family [Nocardioides terrae]|uniref:Uncharacterized conserved protein, DUF1015 family n=1 Tax=Nocardioides terrae TaxID=574651 RepID=A0A1I1NQ46_9ACTN|nr:DUF1015 family protein [Nocardioides terrae]SFC99791.1 Uncharacterized conserved protein, DUF1015 family [Nocardioides terrae]
MDASDVVTPPYLAGPLSLLPFAAQLLQPSRIGDPGTGRLFARPYRSVHARLRHWRERGWITTDPHPAIYLHEYSSAGRTVRGIVGTLELGQRGTGPAMSRVLPHEGIHPAQVDELAARMGEMRLNPAPILLVHRGSPALRRLLGDISAAPPTRQFEDAGGQRHRLWAVRAPEELAAIQDEIAPSRALIADGHHRYAAYLRMQAESPGTDADSGLAMLVDHVDTPLQLHAIHRALAGVRLDRALDALTTLGVPVEFRPVAVAAAPDAATLLLTDGHRWALARLPPHPGTVVEYVHDTLLPAIERRSQRVSHHPDPEEAVSTAHRRRGTALILPAPTFEQVLEVAVAGRLLPEKATSFQPKPHLGVLMRSLNDG